MMWLVLTNEGAQEYAHDAVSAQNAAAKLLALREDKRTTIMFLPMPETKPECKCQKRSGTCRCFCPRCWSTSLEWKAWGAYLDKDLVCRECGKCVDSWNC